MAPRFERLRDEYAALWSECVIRPERKSEVMAVARQIRANRSRYEPISRATGVPWWFIGLVHNMECGLDFSRHLHNGDSLQRRTRLVPKGRPTAHDGPFTFEESAIDALTMPGKQFDKVKDWSIEHVAYLLEKYNGWGYRGRNTGIHSPYLWSFTNLYSRGKFIRDHVYSPTAVSGQIGTMAILKALTELDPQLIEADMPAPAAAWPKAAPLAVEARTPAAAVVAVTKTAAKSRSVWALLVSAGLWVMSKLEWVVDYLFGFLPGAVTDVESQVSAIEAFGKVLRLNWVEVTSGLAIVLMGIAIWRHTRDKSELEERRAEGG